MTYLPSELNWTYAVSDERIRTAKIMVIDDEPVCERIVQLYLRDYNFSTFLSPESPATALDAVLEHRPDVILLDILMGDVNGLDVLQAIRNDSRVAHTPVIILTISSDDAIKQTALNLGATDFLTKPLDPKDLAPRVRNAVAMTAYQEHLRAYADLLKDEVLQRRQAETQLEKAARRATDENVAKSDFLARMSHEIRTPMTAILGFTDLLLNDLVNEENDATAQQRNSLRTIHRNGEYLMQIINDILDISKIEAGKLAVERTPTCIFRQVAEVMALMRVRAEVKGLKLEVDFDGKLPEEVHTDPTRLRQILINLVGNAIKFTTKGHVKLTVRYEKEPQPRIRFIVADTGPGMTGEQIARAFQPFVQADETTTRRYGGTGLGLPISRRLADLLGGDVEVESEPGAGSRFSATIGALGATQVPLVEAPADILKDVLSASEKPELASKQLAARVLLAEDGHDNRRLITFLLERAGVDVTVAEDGQVAVEQVREATAKRTPFDVILMDMQMPVLDGYQATTQLRQMGVTTPIVALTACAMSQDRDKCLHAGCDDYMTKPVVREKLLKLVARYSQNQGQNRVACDAETATAKR